MRRNLIPGNLTKKILGCCINVHKTLGPGFIEKIYEQAVADELRANRLHVERQKSIPVFYRKTQIGYHRLDLVVENAVLIELKACTNIEDIHIATTLSYLKASNLQVALLLNYATPTLSIRRFANSIFDGRHKRGIGELATRLNSEILF